MILLLLLLLTSLAPSDCMLKFNVKGAPKMSTIFESQYFVLRNETMNKDYIEFRHGYGCYSLAGRNGQKQEIVLDPRCGEKQTLIHEVNSVDT